MQGKTDLQITKTGSPATQTVTKLPYGDITWTMTVTNNGPLVDTGVQVGDPLPVEQHVRRGDDDEGHLLRLGRVCSAATSGRCRWVSR